jgi:opacity protein-like surface antigen
MKKFFFTLFCLVCTASTIVAQEEVRPFEFEAGFGITQGQASAGEKATVGLSLAMELRYNIPNTPFDLGLRGSLGAYDRDHSLIDNHIWNQHIMPRSVTLYADYNHGRNKNVSLFGGLGLGYTHVINQLQTDDPNFWDKDTLRENYFAVSPRIGVEFFHRLRLTVDYRLMSKYSFGGISIGFVFGGGVKK